MSSPQSTSTNSAGQHWLVSSIALSDHSSYQSGHSPTSYIHHPNQTFTQTSTNTQHSYHTAQSGESTPKDHANFTGSGSIFEYKVQDADVDWRRMSTDRQTNTMRTVSMSDLTANDYQQLMGSGDFIFDPIKIKVWELLLALIMPFPFGAHFGSDEATWSPRNLLGALWALIVHQRYAADSVRAGLFTWSVLVTFVSVLVWSQTSYTIQVIAALCTLYYSANLVFLLFLFCQPCRQQVIGS